MGKNWDLSPPQKPVGLTVKTVRSTGFFAYLHTLFSYNRVAIWGAIV